MRLRPILPAFAALSLSCAGPSHRPVEPGARSTSVVEEPVALDRSDDGARPARGPAPVDASTTLDDLLERAALWSPRARAAEARWRAAYERVPQASRLSDPRFAWTEFVEGVQTRTGEQQRRFVLSQRFPWPGTLDARERAAAHGADAARAAAVADVIEIQRGVAHLWYELAYVSAAREVVAQNVALIESLQPVVLGRIRAGGPREDALRLEVRIARERDELSSLGEREAQVRARLIAAVGLTESATLPPATFPGERQPIGELDALHASAVEGSPLLDALEGRMRAAAAAVDVARLDGRPDFGLGVSYIETGAAIDPTTPGSGNDPVGLTVDVGLPIQRGSEAARVREAEANVRASRAALDDAIATLRADLADALFHVQDAGRTRQLYDGALLPRAQETFELTLSSYEGGDASLLDLVDALTGLLELRLGALRATRDLHQGEVHVHALLGGPIQ